MGSVTSLVRPRPVVDGPDTAAGTWGPLIRPVAGAFLLLALILNSGAIGGVPGLVLPNTLPLLVGLGCVGLAVLVPRDRPVVIPFAAFGILGLLVMSVLWSRDEAASILWLRSSGLITIGIAALVLVLPTSDTVGVLKGYVRVVLFITLVAVTIEPLARIHIDPLGQSPPLKGWHGYFLHKNVMAAFLIFAAGTVLSFDRNRWTRWLSVAAIAFLFIVSDSTTGRMAVLVLVAVQLWLTTNRRLSGRSSAALGAATAALVAVIGVAIGTSLSTIADAAGKDLTFTGRTKIWAASWHAFLRDPIVGHGVNGLFGSPRTVETAEVMRETGFQAGHPHNGLLDVAVQLGGVGIVLVVGVVFGIFRAAGRLQRRSPRFAGWGLCVMSGIVIMSVGESVFLGAAVATMIILRTLLLREATERPRGLETTGDGRRRAVPTGPERLPTR